MKNLNESAIQTAAQNLMALRSQQTSRIASELRAAPCSLAWLQKRAPRTSAKLPGIAEPELRQALEQHCLEELDAWELRLLDCERCPEGAALCDAAGRYDLHAPGLQPAWQNGVIDSARCDHWREYQLRQHLRGRGVPELLIAARLENFEPRKSTLALEAAQKFCEDMRLRLSWPTHPVRSLLFFGQGGCGKSHLAVATLATLATVPRKLRPTDGAWLLYVHTPRFVQQARGQIGSDDEGDLFGRATAAHVLVLDDIGGVRPTDWSTEQLTLLVSARLDAGRPSIFTTSSEQKFERVFGEFAAKLVRHMDGYELAA